MDKEDGEMSDDNAMLIDNDDGPVSTAPKTKIDTEEDCTVLYKAEKNGLVVKQLEKVDAAKLEERAKRFGLNLTGNRVITQRQIDELYANFGIESGNERHFRFDALYLNGVDGLTTKEIFEYLEDYKPLSLEWIDDVSCNVVCQDHISAALALLVHTREIKNEELKEMLADKSNHHWREGMPHPKQDLILIRFATNGEKKKLKKSDTKNLDQYYVQTMDSANKNPWGDLCKSWGVYDHQEVFQRKLLTKNDYEDEIGDVKPKLPIQIRNKKLAMRLGKRRQDNNEQSDESASDSEWKLKSKAPRMRMHADDEESKLKKEQVSKPIKPVEQDLYEKYAPLSIEVVNSQSTYVKKEYSKLSDKFKFHGGSKQNSVQSRLGEKIVPTNEHSSQSEASSDESSNGDSDHNLMSKVQKVNSKSSKTGSVWSRLETQQKQTSAQSDLRQILKSRTKPSKPQNSDLRDRLGKSKPANLRIEIDNNRYSDDSE